MREEYYQTLFFGGVASTIGSAALFGKTTLHHFSLESFHVESLNMADRVAVEASPVDKRGFV